MNCLLYFFIGALCLNQGFAQSTNLNEGEAPGVAKRSIDDGPQSSPHIIHRRDDGGSKPSNPLNPLPGGGGQTNALPHRRSVDDVLAHGDIMPIPHVIHKRQEESSKEGYEILDNETPPPPRTRGKK
ncbi:uncharacterized protein LOC121412189 [Lytechinus variegatus]|uniref:uncharacterized protein LOC121412189 n=1 Tax=Lytechinus variegatus TaxID=7654 RepID=UPI001BB15CBA|nr:uncharacterized protein LOC121412189 [Lytechinus variegatus]